MNNVIVITSGKGGVGKTTVVANVGSCLAELGKSVVLIDADVGLRNLDIVLGLEIKAKYNIIDVSRGITTLDKALIYDKRSENRLALLAASQSHQKEDLKKEDFTRIIAELKSKFDYVIIDCPAGIEYGFHNSIRNATRAIIVVNPDVSSIRDADRVIGIIENEKLRKIDLIVNRVNPELLKKKELITIEEIEEILGLKLIGLIPEDSKIILSTNVGKPVLYGKEKQLINIFMDIAKRINGEKILVTLEKEFVSKSETIWNKVKKSFTVIKKEN